MAEILAIDISSFFQDRAEDTSGVVFPEGDAIEIKLADLPEGSAYAKLFTPVDFDPKAEPYLIEIPPNKTIPSHFFIHKGEEVGYLLSGKLQLKMEKAVYNVKPGDMIYLTSEMPSQWKNSGSGVARLLWMKIT